MVIRHTHKVSKTGKIKVVQTKSKMSLLEKLAVKATGGKRN
jgi:hypothetical protein